MYFLSVSYLRFHIAKLIAKFNGWYNFYIIMFIYRIQKQTFTLKITNADFLIALPKKMKNIKVPFFKS